MTYRAYVRCDICNRWMSREEAEASAAGVDEPVCSTCWTPTSPTTDADQEAHDANDSPLA